MSPHLPVLLSIDNKGILGGNAKQGRPAEQGPPSPSADRYPGSPAGVGTGRVRRQGLRRCLDALNRAGGSAPPAPDQLSLRIEGGPVDRRSEPPLRPAGGSVGWRNTSGAHRH